jgi:hypothetical protein
MHNISSLQQYFLQKPAENTILSKRIAFAGILIFNGVTRCTAKYVLYCWNVNIGKQ